MWGWGRPKRDLPQIDYNESSDEDDFETGLNFRSPLQSPRRPLPTREGSPVLVEGGPTLADNVDDELEEVQYKLHDIATTREEIEEVTELLQTADTRVTVGSERVENLDSTESEEIVSNSVEVVSGVISVPAASDSVNDQPVRMANFEDENGADDNGAMKDACARVEKLHWMADDLLFLFGQIEATNRGT